MVDTIKRPLHYATLDPQPMDVIEAWDLDFHRANVLKYIARAELKGHQLEDLRKARMYLDRCIYVHECAEAGVAPLSMAEWTGGRLVPAPAGGQPDQDYGSAVSAVPVQPDGPQPGDKRVREVDGYRWHETFHNDEWFIDMKELIQPPVQHPGEPAFPRPKPPIDYSKEPTKP